MTKATPCDRLRVVLLRLLPGPDIRSLDGKQDVPVIVDDRVHQD